MIEASLLDRMISYLSPQRGAARLAARQQIEALGYAGARVGRREDGWVTASTSSNAEIAGDRITLRNRVRSLIRDNSYAVKGLEALVVNRVGTGILTTAAGENDRTNKRLQKRWKRWVDRCDYAGKTDYYGLQALAERCRIEAGEAFIRFITIDDDQDDIPLRLQVLEPDHLDTTKNLKAADGRGETIEGIEYANGKASAYWLYETHPGDTNPVIGAFSSKSVRVPANQVIHYFRPLRAGQLTGVTEFAPVIRPLYDLVGYADAELLRKKIAACSIGAVTTQGGLPAQSLATTSIDASGRRNESFAPGMWHYFKPGESVEFFDPKPSNGFGEFFEVQLHGIASGLKLPYELMTGDFSKVNWTSFRAALVQFKAMVEADQWQLVIPQVCLPIWDRFVMYAEGRRVPAKFTPPRFGLLDPSKEIPAMRDAIQAGLRTLSGTLRSDGYEPDEIFDEAERERKDLAKRGLAFTSFESKIAVAEATAAAAPAEPDPVEEERAVA